MHDFIDTIQRKLIEAAPPALAVMAVGGLILALLYWAWYGKAMDASPGKKPSKGQLAAALLLLCYLGGLAAVTLMRMNSGIRMDIQTRPFLALMEAWGAFTLQVWLNPLLNIAMFVPLGVLLPLAVRLFRRWYWMLAAGAGVSFVIEALQYILKRGQADVDDLICNTLGAMLGYCLCMAVASLPEKRWKATATYAVLPVLSAAALAGVFIAYQLQPYGNLTNAPVFAANVRHISWELVCELPSQPETAGVYWAEPFTKASGDEFAQAFAQRRGVDLWSAGFDIDYYDNSAYYSDHHTFMLWLDYNDRSYQYSDCRVDSWGEENWSTATETELREYLAGLGIDVPEAVEFLDEGKGKYIFRALCVEQDGILIDGELTCQVAGDGQVYQVDNALSACTLHSEVSVISPEEAYSRLCAGWINRPEAYYFEHSDAGEVRVTACTLEYIADTKGFRQPVYYFTLSDDYDEALRGGSAWRVFVPARA